MPVIEDSLGVRRMWAACAFALGRIGHIRHGVRRTAAAVLLATAALYWQSPAFAAPGFGFGVFPQLSTRTTAETYQPLADYLSAALGQPVNLESAKDFFTFHTRTIEGEYELVLTAPHLAWLAWKEGGYRPLLIYREPAKGFVVVKADSPYRRLGDLKGKTIAIPDTNAVVNIRLAKILAGRGLNPGRELTVREAGSHTNAAAYVDTRQTDAAVVGVFPFLRLPSAERKRLRILAATPDLPSHVFLVHPRMDSQREREIRQAIEGFMRSEAGLDFLEKTGFRGVRALEKDELKQVEGDALELKRRFQELAGAGEAPR